MDLLFNLFLISTTLLLSTAHATPIGIIYKFVDAFEPIWNDRGSGSHKDVSLWRPIDVEKGFYLLGDFASASYDKPSLPSVTVFANTTDALAEPADCTQIWNDRGSGADKDVTIYRLEPPSGYSCLGDVAVDSYSTKPQLDKYRCVKSDFVVEGSGGYDFIWNDRGSGANKDVSIYRNRDTDSEDGREPYTFTANKIYGKPSGHPKLLKVSTSIENPPPHDDLANKAIVVYQVDSTERIWYDGGSGARRDFSSWRAKVPNGYYSLGDYAKDSHSTPHFTLFVRALKEDALAAPLHFIKKWDDRGSGSWNDVMFFEPTCPSGYRAIGDVSIGSYSKEPSKKDFRCVKKEYTVPGKWEFVWNDKGSGAKHDVTVYMAVPVSENGQGLRAMGVRSCYCDMDRKAYVLNSTITQYIVHRPVNRYILKNLHYKLDDREIINKSPEVLATTDLINKGLNAQTSTRVLTYNYDETHSWSNTVGLELGISYTVNAGIPEVASHSKTISATAKFSSTTGKSITESKSDQIRVQIDVEPKSKKTATVAGSRYVVDVPFTATLIPVYTDESQGSPVSYNGIYKGVQVHDVKIVYEAAVPLSE